MLELERQPFAEHGLNIAARHYYVTPDEGAEAMFARVAKAVACKASKSVRKKAEQDFYKLVVTQRFCPGGRVLAGAGSTHGSLLNCFVQDGSPELSGTTHWVLELARKLALVTKVGGGNGLNSDPLYPKKAFSGKGVGFSCFRTKSTPMRPTLWGPKTPTVPWSDVSIAR